MSKGDKGLLPADMAASKLAYEAKMLASWAKLIQNQLEHGKPVSAELRRNWRKSYSAVSTAQLELERHVDPIGDELT